jgi:hypothetical protein
VNQENIENGEKEEEEEKFETEEETIHSESRTTLTGDSEIAEGKKSDETNEAEQMIEMQRNEEIEIIKKAK